MKYISTDHNGIKILALLIFLFITGCEKIEIGEPFDCKIGTKYRIENSLSFTIDSIVDYRCPRDVNCAWSGDVKFYFKINHGILTTDTLIYLYTHNNNPFNIEEYTWHINTVDPWLALNQTADPRDYRINILITKN